MNPIAIALAALLTAGIWDTAAQAQQHQHQGQYTRQGPPLVAPGAVTPSTKGYQDANAKMHRDMDIPFSGDADADFVRGMIPHHQGAIDMAKVVLAHGKDPQIRKLAEAIIRDQEKEIAMMRDWLTKNGK